MQVVSEEEWSEANWKQGYTYTTHKGAFRVINILCATSCFFPKKIVRFL